MPTRALSLSGREREPGPLPGHWIRDDLRLALIYDRDGGACLYCGATDTPIGLDHVEPQIWGRRADNRPGNLAACCYDCNTEKGALSLSAWCDLKGLDEATIRARVALPFSRHAGKKMLANRLISRFGSRKRLKVGQRRRLDWARRYLGLAAMPLEAAGVPF